MYNENMF